MIISASRRTDIPSYYSDWFINRLREGYVYVRNPMNYRQVSNVPLSPELQNYPELYLITEKYLLKSC